MSAISFGNLNVREITIDDRKAFLYPTEVSFFTFSNIFSWRHAMNYKIAELESCEVIVGKYRDEPITLLFPFHLKNISPASVALDVKRILGDERILFTPLMADQTGEIAKNFPDAEIFLSDDLFDYIYNTSDLISLKGKRFHQKRNHLNGFLSKYSYEYVAVHSGDAEALRLLREAYELLYGQSEDPDLIDEHAEINELIENFDSLGLCAGVILVDKRPVAYSIGERISEKTALIHIEKADRSFSGAYAAINKMFAQREFSDTLFINREEDMGLEGLRKAKLSYHPVKMGEYYSALI